MSSNKRIFLALSYVDQAGLKPAESPLPLRLLNVGCEDVCHRPGNKKSSKLASPLVGIGREVTGCGVGMRIKVAMICIIHHATMEENPAF